MRTIRQPRKKESSIQLPATSLHLMQVSKFIQEYLHCQQKYMINLSTAVIQTHLPIRVPCNDRSFDIDLNVPYIESQHYDSRATFTDEQKQIDMHMDEEDENFTDREGFNSVSSDSEMVSCRHRKLIEQEEEEEEKFKLDDFKFIKHENASKESVELKNSLTITIGTQPNNSTKESREFAMAPTCMPVDEVQLQHLQETAYFLQERQRVERRLMQESQQQENVSSLNQPQGKGAPSKKAIFLNKIEKEKSRKQIAQALNRQRHHIKRFLK